MKTTLGALFLLTLATFPAVAQTPVFSRHPIFITLDSNCPGSLLINRVSCGLDEGREWLDRASVRYGRYVPVVIIADAKVPSGTATDTVKMALASHDKVCGLIQGASPFEPLHYFTSGTLSDPSGLLDYLRPPRLIYWAPSARGFSSTDLIVPPPHELIDRLTTPTIK